MSQYNHIVFKGIILVIVLLNSAFGQDKNTLFKIPKLDSPIVLDGRVDEPAWEKIAPLPLVTHWPGSAGKAF